MAALSDAENDGGAVLPSGHPARISEEPNVTHPATFDRDPVRARRAVRVEANLRVPAEDVRVGDAVFLAMSTPLVVRNDGGTIEFEDGRIFRLQGVMVWVDRP
jgi:hypothetical protein